MWSLSYIFADNKIVVDCIMAPNGKIHKHHVALSFHRVKESIAVEIVNCLFADGNIIQQMH